MTPNPLPTGLMLIHGNQPEALRDLLVTWMKRYPIAPLEHEIILVQSNGIAQWLKLALAENMVDGDGGGCGIAAALEMSLPSRFLWQVYRSFLGNGAVPESSPFDKPLLVWRLMRLLPALMVEPVFAPLHRFLADDPELRKRFQLAERLADLYDQYQVYRADWLAAWAEEEDVLIRAKGDRQSLTADLRWQASLWRALLTDIGVDREGNAGRASVHSAFLKNAEQRHADDRPPGLPRRVLVFGISSLPRQSLEVLASIARWSQVLMCVHNPCEHYWADIVADKDLLRAAQKRQQRRAGMPDALSEENLHQHAHPLLAAWGKQGRDFIGLLDEHDSDTARAGYLQHFVSIQQRIDLFFPHGQARLLNQLQDDIRDLRPLAESRALWPAVDPSVDASIRFHIAHSPQREVEILHDQLLAAFNEDVTLRPRDIIVMMPDIDLYAPHIQAVFGLSDEHDSRHIPFSIADQVRRVNDPLLKALETLLSLPRARMSASDVLDLLEVPALRCRFGISDEELPLLQRWIHGSNIRWGLHTRHRMSLGLPEGHQENTWQFGIKRMLLGYAVGNAEQAWRDIEPFDEIGGLGAALLGPLVQLLDQLETTWEVLSEPATIPVWRERMRDLMTDYFLAEGSDDALTLRQLDDALEDLQEACGQARFNEPLPLAVVADHWLAGMNGGGLSQRFLAGSVTFATLMPMRAIPFRQVCLLGMNDGDYPRTRVPMDFDLMGKDYRPGDRSRREDDRYLFLEALLSARECLRISCVGRSVTDNTPRPPSVLVGQLRDHLGAGWRLAGPAREAGEGAGALLKALTVEHRLQPFSLEYFPAQDSVSPLFTYAREWRVPVMAHAESARDTALPPLQRDEPVSVEELANFLRDPVKDFFKQRLRVSFETEDPASADQEPFDLDALQKWSLNNELITVQAAALQRGDVREAALTDRLGVIRRRGDLAAKGFADVMADTLAAPMEDLFNRYLMALGRWPLAQEGEEAIHFKCKDLELSDWLRDVRLDAEGRRGRVVLESRDAVKNGTYQGHVLIKHWVFHLAAHFADGPITTQVVSKVGDVEFSPMESDAAGVLLESILDAWRQGSCRPLPLAVKTAFAWLSKRVDGAGQDPEGNDEAAMAAACRVYEGDGYKQDGELGNSTYLQRAYPDFAALTVNGEFAELAETLLRPLHRAMFVNSKGKRADKYLGASA